jgi:hypothetical protein
MNCTGAMQASDLYVVRFADGSSVRAKRVVCALGPNLKKDQMFWEEGAGVAGVDYPAHAWCFLRTMDSAIKS